MPGMNLGEIVSKEKDRRDSVTQYPPCPNKSCECHGTSDRVTRSGVGGNYYCYECCQTF